ncbi:MAG: LptF/LptG family permease [Bacteroidales bacterium]|nr:LptF/LptG family permease [Bacteroidales bacterium]
MAFRPLTRQTYKILDRYILGKYLKTFLLAMLLIIVIVITFDISEKLDDFLDSRAPISQIIFNYYCNFIPGFVNLYSPLFIFISVLFFTSKMASNTEIIAILGSGISYKRLLQPYLHGSVIVAFLILLLGNFVIPWSNQYLIAFEDKYIHTMHRNNYVDLHFQSAPGTLVYAQSYDVRSKTAFRYQQDSYNEEGLLVERLTADNITYDSVELRWLANRLVIRTVEGDKEHLEQVPRDMIDINLTPNDFNLASTNITTLNTPQLIQYIHEQKLRGTGKVTTAKIELYQRFLTPLAVIVMTFIGVAISSRKTRGGIGVHLAIGISIAFAFIVFMRISVVFATNGNLSPFLAVLLPQLLFALAAVYLIHTAPK